MNKYREKWNQEVGPESPMPTFTAEELLTRMRPEVENILVQLGCLQPPSQSCRAKQVMEEIEEEIKDMIQRKAPIKEVTPLFSKRRLLEDFLAVHRAVWILEGKPL